MDIKISRSGGNVFKDLGYSSDEAQNLRLRSVLMAALCQYIHRHHLTQSAAADIFAVSQPRISDLRRGKIALFSLDTLVNMAARAGISLDFRMRLRSGGGASKGRARGKELAAAG